MHKKKACLNEAMIDSKLDDLTSLVMIVEGWGGFDQSMNL